MVTIKTINANNMVSNVVSTILGDIADFFSVFLLVYDGQLIKSTVGFQKKSYEVMR
jgi:hypothetical protein